jgi:hypothetical protein
MSSSEDEDAMDTDIDDVHSSGDEDRKKRSMKIKLLKTRKKSRSIDQGESFHTGLSPRIQKMEIVSTAKKNPDYSGLFFLDDGVETFSLDGDPRLPGVHELYRELDHRLENAAISAGLPLDDPAVCNMKTKLALRSAELESNIAENFGGPNTRTYRDAMYRVICWIQGASDSDLRDFLDGHLTNFYLENQQQPSVCENLEL